MLIFVLNYHLPLFSGMPVKDLMAVQQTYIVQHFHASPMFSVNELWDAKLMLLS